MQHFYKRIEKAKELVKENQLAKALQQLDEAFRILIYEETEDPLLIDGKMVIAVDSARKITAQVLELPEIETNKFIENTMDFVRKSIEDYLQDKITADAFWEAMVELGRLMYFLEGVSGYLIKKGLPLGSSDNPAITVSLAEDGSMQLNARISEDGISLEEASELQHTLSEAMTDENAGPVQLINLAGKLLTGQQFSEAIKVYETIVFRFPEETAQCLNAIGACYYYLEDYEQAIQFYMKALESGELKSRVEYNVWESCQSIIDRISERKEQMKWKFFFEDNFPESKHEIVIG
jgi:tetratricopeptide (TPR) repeat protein